MTDPAQYCTLDPPPLADGSPRPFDPAWRTETVLALAKGIEADTAFDRLPILADALEEAGCDDPVILRHCRECERHESGCWVVTWLVTDPKRVPSVPAKLEWGDDGIPSVYSDEVQSRLRGAEDHALGQMQSGLTVLYFLIVFLVFAATVWAFVKTR